MSLLLWVMGINSELILRKFDLKFQSKQKDDRFRILLSSDTLHMKPIDESSNRKILMKKTHQQLDEMNQEEDQKEGFNKLNKQK